MARTLTVTAPAKVNLALHVVGRRADGYHLLESLAVFAGHGDTLTAAPAEADTITVSGRYAAQVPIDGGNLVAQARDLLREHFGAAAQQPVALKLEKRLPVASGIGGGSSDAAATMRMLCGFWDIRTDESELARLGLRLGADVPMCLAGRPLVARGIGEEIEPLADFPALPLVLVNPGVPLATAQVFAALDAPQNAAMPAIRAAAHSSVVIDWLADTRNDLEGSALTLVPEIADALAALRARGARVARMSGAGATCFGLFDTAAQAGRAAAAIEAAEPGWFVAATMSEAGREGAHAG